MAKAVGRITRGTTGVNRLRRVDRWIAAHPVVRRTDDPLVVDLGYGASATTTLELRDRLARLRPDVEVVGIEIDPDRVARAAAAARDGVTFRRGGFEIPTDRRPAVIRALNVLRQYAESEVPDAWATMCARLQPGGVLVEGTCNEVGRVASWIALGPDGPQTFTISLRLADLEQPSVVAERLPKALIHHNVRGERVHLLLAELDRHWARRAPLAVYGATQRFIASVEALRADGWPVHAGRSRWRLGELTLDWAAVAPEGAGFS